VSHRPLALVFGLTLGDYLLWSWSLNGNHDVLALVSGFTLPPLAVACAWMLALTLTRLIARSTRHSRAQAAAGRRHAAGRGTEGAEGTSATTAGPSDQTAAPAPTPSAPAPGKLAA
jgi:hypothetical protein